MTDRAPYSRVYWEIVDDPKFENVYDNDHALALWLRLLLAADQAHPASATLPVGSRKSAITILVDANLITVTGSRFRIVGLDAERGKRTETARNASASRWQSERGTKPDASGMPRRDETRQDEPNARANGQGPKRVFAPARRPNTSPLQKEIRAAIVERYGEGETS